MISTVAGNGSIGFSGDGGPATAAALGFPVGIAVDASGNLFIAGSGRVRKVTASTGVISTVAGVGVDGFSGDGGPATEASMNFPLGIAVDGAGNLFIADVYNDRIRKVAAATGIISTVVGTGAEGVDGDGGPATAASLNFPTGITVDSAGNLFVADTHNGRVRKVAAATGIISTVAGTGVVGLLGDGVPATAALLNDPKGIVVDGAGNLFIADSDNNRVRKVTPAGIISTVAGTGTQGLSGDGGSATTALFANPEWIAIDGAGNLFIVDTDNHRIRAVRGAAVPRP